jgi:hypothetical protein
MSALYLRGIPIAVTGGPWRFALMPFPNEKARFSGP